MNPRCLLGHRYPPRPAGVRFYCQRRWCSHFIATWRVD